MSRRISKAFIPAWPIHESAPLYAAAELDSGVWMN